MNFRKFLVISLAFFAGAVRAQDNITYSQESDTLVKQRFIDRYENVFMTKVPTRQMVKLGVGRGAFGVDFGSASQVFDLNHELGYEYKLFPDLSVGGELSLNSSFFFRPSFIGTVSGTVYSRWYYDMKRRIEQGKSANNFSGNYVSVVVGNRLRYVPYRFSVIKIGAEFGVQRRFLNHGLLDFGIGIFYQHYGGTTSKVEGLPGANKSVSGIAISTRSSVSLAFGDWKRKAVASDCELLNCDQFLSQQWKVLWPSLNIGTQLAQGIAGAGYERKIGKSPLSVNTEFIVDYMYSKPNFVVNYAPYLQRTYQLQSFVQLRYYYLQKKKIRTGRGGNNLSGIYVGPHLEYITNRRADTVESKNQYMGLGLTYGYQKTLFGNVYIDVNGNVGWSIWDRSVMNTALRIGFGLSL